MIIRFILIYHGYEFKFSSLIYKGFDFSYSNQALEVKNFFWIEQEKKKITHHITYKFSSKKRMTNTHV